MKTRHQRIKNLLEVARDELAFVHMLWADDREISNHLLWKMESQLGEALKQITVLNTNHGLVHEAERIVRDHQLRLAKAILSDNDLDIDELFANKQWLDANPPK